VLIDYVPVLSIAVSIYGKGEKYVQQFCAKGTYCPVKGRDDRAKLNANVMK
jgi:hypothetical protein